jgi:hypothetical protein
MHPSKFPLLNTVYQSNRKIDIIDTLAATGLQNSYKPSIIISLLNELFCLLV